MLLEVEQLAKHFPLRREHPGQRRSWLKAVDGVSLAIRQGESLGIVGESGCGKSTLARLVCALTPPTSGSITFDGIDLSTLHGRPLRRLRRRFQMVFQNPYTSLNPRKSVGLHLEEPLKIHHGLTADERLGRAESALLDVGLTGDYLQRSPAQLSGGQRQRVAIARALVLEPDLLICDEVVSALDVSVKADILNLLQDLRSQYNLSLLFISHDLGVVRYICDRVAVMYLGRILEEGVVAEVFKNPRNPYTEGLLAAVPRPRPDASTEWLEVPMKGEPPSPVNPPSGCRFRTRCELAEDVCASVVPELNQVGPRHRAACHVRASEREVL